MRISDWSSDVCSSDLDKADALANAYLAHRREATEALVTDMVTSIDLELLALGGLPVGEVDAATAARVTRINDLQAQKASLLAIPVSPGTLIDPARLAEEPSGTPAWIRSEEHTSELQSLMRISYAVFCLKKKKKE